MTRPDSVAVEDGIVPDKYLSDASSQSPNAEAQKPSGEHDHIGFGGPIGSAAIAAALLFVNRKGSAISMSPPLITASDTD